MDREQLEALLEVYTLSEILANIDLEEIDLLVLLEEQGYFNHLPLPNPL